MYRFSGLRFALSACRQAFPASKQQAKDAGFVNPIHRALAANAFCQQANESNDSESCGRVRHLQCNEDGSRIPTDQVVRGATSEQAEVALFVPDALRQDHETDCGLSERLRPVNALSESVQVNLDDIPRLFPKSFTLAAYVNQSETLQQFVNLGVDLSLWDRNADVQELVVRLDFEKDVKQYIRFLHDVGVPPSELGRFFTKNPHILQTPIEDLQVRINYLESKRFRRDDISRIVSGAPRFLSHSTVDIDKRLGFLQKRFKLTGDELRSLVVLSPKFAIWDTDKIKHRHFSIKEQLGFTDDEIKALVLAKPRIWMMDGRFLVERFTYLHNKMGVPHSLVINHPGALLRRTFSLKQRHLYLKALNRAEYDPTKDRYVSLKALTSGSDADFCRDVAKTSVQKFNEFLKTL